MNDLRQFFENNEEGNLFRKWTHYFEIYDRYFSSYRGKEVVLLEVGVYEGGSLQMWKEYFGAKARIYGVDINPDCKTFEDDQTRIFIGDQADRNFLSTVSREIPSIDILIDDGGHTMKQQIATFEVLYSHVAENGFYVCEDLHTSYWKEWGGGYKKRGTFIEYGKSMIDAIHAWHSNDKRLEISALTRSTYALHFFDSMLVVEKRNIEKPCEKMSGKPVLPPGETRVPSFWEKLCHWLQQLLRLRKSMRKLTWH